MEWRAAGTSLLNEGPELAPFFISVYVFVLLQIKKRRRREGLMTKPLLAILLLLPLVACGPSQEEIDNIATITCNIMGESRNMDAAMRIKEINSAREKIGQAPYLGTDDGIKESFEWGMCEELVKNDPAYQNQLTELKVSAAEQKRIAEEQAAEQKRIAEEQAAEQKRIAIEKATENRRLYWEEKWAILRKHGFICPLSQEELKQISDKAWEDRNPELNFAASALRKLNNDYPDWVDC